MIDHSAELLFNFPIASIRRTEYIHHLPARVALLHAAFAALWFFTSDDLLERSLSADE
jgi:hypothetical protein